MRVFSNGGGKQSTAALVLSAQGKLDFPIHLFSNVGDDSENPDSLAYVREVVMPYAANTGIRFIEVRRESRDYETLLQRTLREDKSIHIPVRMANGAPGNRTCTQDFKRSVIHKWLGKGEHIVGLGISLDEYQRMRNDSGYKNIINEYPLIDLRLTRTDCIRIIREAGLPQPPKSSCWFCPFHTTTQWNELRREKPALFAQAVELEQTINQKRLALGKDKVFLSGRAIPLMNVTGDQPLLFEADDTCESGYCMT